jgi:hypothetical protein
MIAFDFVRRALASGVVLCAAILAGGAQAPGDDALSILKKMSAYIGGQPTIELAFDSDIEVITDDMQKIQFASSEQVMLSRPRGHSDSESQVEISPHLIHSNGSPQCFRDCCSPSLC